MLESSLQSENITYRPHAARGCVKLQSKHIRNTYDRYITIIIIYENCTVRLASVGLAQARPNNTITPPIYSTPNLFSDLNIHRTVNAPSNSCTNQKAGLLTKQNLGEEWSRPFCSRPWVGGSKGPKPVVMQGPERVLP